MNRELLANVVVILSATVLIAGGEVADSSFIAVVAPAPIVPQVKKDASDKDKLQGTWSIIAIETNAQRRTPAQNGLKKYVLTFKGDKITTQWIADDEREPPAGGGEFDYRLDDKASPKNLDIQSSIPIRGIYKLDDDTLTFCFFGRSGPDRPGEFSTAAVPAGNPVLWVLKRDKTSSK